MFGITSLRENGSKKTDTKEKVDLCNRQFQSAFTREAKIVNEYDQEKPQSQPADKPMAPRGRATQQSRDTRKTN